MNDLEKKQKEYAIQIAIEAGTLNCCENIDHGGMLFRSTNNTSIYDALKLGVYFFNRIDNYGQLYYRNLAMIKIS